MDDSPLSRTRDSVVVQVGALELLARYSMNEARAASTLSSLHEYRTNEIEHVGGKQWNWKYLRDQFDQKDLEGLYRKYDDKLRESLIYIYISLLIVISTIHIVFLIAVTHFQEIEWKSTYFAIGMFVLRLTVPTLLLWKGFYEPLKQKWFWIPIFVTFIITLDLVITDVAIAIFSSFDGVILRPAYATISLISVYIFLPMRNNFLAIFLGTLVSAAYSLTFALFTYDQYPQIGFVRGDSEAYNGTMKLIKKCMEPNSCSIHFTAWTNVGLEKISSDVVYLIGVNLMGVYFRLMNEIVTRRSFLDRRACVESTLRLKFVKDQEERLMLSILPEHIASRVSQDIRTLLMGLQRPSRSHKMKSFNQLYVEEHKNVSILYADVVNYTMISTTLSPMRMVELLNELFGRFDEASEEHEVLRIKFLGDCYYCVSGVPKPTPQHAKNCVDLGLEMIRIIKDVREKRSLNIDMRIGVHSGRILSGLIGIRKWQFDIWSKDVTIANKMESTGKSGKVHVTKQTLELLLDYAREYIIEPNFESQNDSFIMKNKLETYLLSRPSRIYAEYKPYRRPSVGFNKIIRKGPRVSPRRSENSRNSTNFRRTTTFMDENLVEYQQMLKAADAQMAKEIEDMTKGKQQFKKESRLNRFTLMYNNWELEKIFLRLPDPLFKYYILCCLLISGLIFLINGLITNWLQGFRWYTWTIFGALLIGLIALQPLTWFQFLWTKYKGLIEPLNPRLRRIYDISAQIIKSAKVRTVIYLIIATGLAATSIVNVIACSEVAVEHDSESTVQSNCISSWHITECWILALLLNFLFSRVFFIFKWIVGGGMTVFYLWIIWETRTSLFKQDATWNIGLDPRICHSLSVVTITITLYWIDRTTEYRNRLDHLWQIQLSEEQKEAETMLQVNNMLLENILPAHVVQIYLDLNRSIDELYYEKYDNVAVMFASLTDYKLGVEDDADISDKIVLSILDEVISEFDQLLMTGTSVHKVEKIKMAGWTYMAACGLDPNRRESLDTLSYDSTEPNRLHNTSYNRAIVLTMVEFAAAMIKQLQNFNRGSYRSFEGLNLRIGISNGEVAAGVVGSLKPLYDIWGHAVNMASRMDSTGVTGKIQVTENTAMILEDCGILTSYRGETFVKGAGYIKTFFVPLDDNYNLVKKDKCTYFYNAKNQNTSEEDDSPINDKPAQIYGVRDLTIDDEDTEDTMTDTPRDSNRTLTSFYSSHDIDNYSDLSSDIEVIETRI